MSRTENMLFRVTFIFENVGKADGVLNKNLNPKTVDAILKALPINSTVNTWGKEIYFSTLVDARQENSKAEVSVGDIAYWPPGKALCLFFGPTPASRDNEPRAASPVNAIGKIIELDILKNVKDGSKVSVIKKEYS